MEQHELLLSVVECFEKQKIPFYDDVMQILS